MIINVKELYYVTKEMDLQLSQVVLQEDQEILVTMIIVIIQIVLKLKMKDVKFYHLIQMFKQMTFVQPIHLVEDVKENVIMIVNVQEIYYVTKEMDSRLSQVVHQEDQEI